MSHAEPDSEPSSKDQLILTHQDTFHLALEKSLKNQLNNNKSMNMLKDQDYQKDLDSELISYTLYPSILSYE